MMPVAAMTPARMSSVTGRYVERAVEPALRSAAAGYRRCGRGSARSGRSTARALSSLEAIIGDSVSAMMPDTTTAPASVKANSRNSAPVRPGDEADRRIHRRQRDRHGDDGHGDLARALERRIEGLHALLDVAVDVLHHDDGVVDDEADGQHQRQQRQQVDGIAERQQGEHHADERQRDGDDRDQRGAQVAEEQEDHHDDDQRGLEQRLLAPPRSRR